MGSPARPVEPRAIAGPARPCGCTGTGPVVWREAGHIARRCACGMVYVDPPPSCTGDEHHFDGYYALPAERRVDWVARWCRPGGRLLEVGPGPGHLLAAARRRGFAVAGVDPNPASARRIREQLGAQVELATIEDSRLPDGSFDVVVHIDLLSHLPDPVAALRAMARLLAPGGHVCFEVGQLGGISTHWYRVMGRVGLPAHRWLFSRAALERVMARAGLVPVGIERYGLAPSYAFMLVRRAAAPLAARLGVRAPGADGLPRPQSLPHHLYERLLLALRYRVGRFVPDVGPQTLLVAARRVDP
jgi:SAM-dependent methyltransferase